MGILQDSCLACHSTDYLSEDTPRKVTMRTAKFGITCIGCHDPHTITTRGESGLTLNEPCISCHVSKNANCGRHTEPAHFPCPQDKVGCVDCHMPYVVKSGGWYSIRGHAFIVLSPLENGQTGMPNSCQNGGCQQDRSPQWIQQEYRTFYKNSSGNN